MIRWTRSSRMRARIVAFGAAGLFVFAGCSLSNNGTAGNDFVRFSSPVLPNAAKRNVVSKYISHVVVIVQENRSFENFFAGYPGADAPMSGCAKPQSGEPIRRASVHCPSGDHEIRLHKVTFEKEPNLTHLFADAMIDWNNGKMDGFSYFGRYVDKHTAAYAYVDRAELTTYWAIARRYVLADAMFPTEFGPSWTAHLTLVAGTDNLNDRDDLALADFSDGSSSSCSAKPGTRTTTVDEKRIIKRAAGPFPCLDQFKTMAQALDHAGVSWRYYVARRFKSFVWSPFAAIKYVRNGTDWDTDVVLPQTKVLSDIKNGTLASVSWVTPSMPDSDHPGSHSDRGPSWVASVVNAIGESSYWKSTAIIVLWDDWGGFYDNVPPPQRDFRGLGIRVPCLIVSPYAKQDYVSHTKYEFGSILKFIEEAFPDVQPLGPTSEGYTDTRATSINDSFNFDQRPRRFKKIPQKYPESLFLNEPRSNEPVDTE